MQRRLYEFKKKHIRKDGTVTIGPNRQWKWVKGETKQRKYRQRGQAKILFSKWFGFLDAYTYNERKQLKCPSGYTFGQGMHALHRLWFAYKCSMSESNINKMKHYARAIQEVQEDMGLKTTSFPHLRIYGDNLVLNKKTNYPNEVVRTTIIDYPHLKEMQRKFMKPTVPHLLIPKENQELHVLDDLISSRRKVNHEISVPNLLETYLEDREIEGDGEHREAEVATLSDEIPFEPDPLIPKENQELHVLDDLISSRRKVNYGATMPNLLEINLEDREKREGKKREAQVATLSDEIHFDNFEEN